MAGTMHRLGGRTVKSPDRSACKFRWGERPREPSPLRFDAPRPARQEPRPTKLTCCQTESSRNPPAADDQIVLIKHRRLAGRDGALGGMQFHLYRTVAGRRHRRGRAGMVVTDFRRDFDGPVSLSNGIQLQFVAVNSSRSSADSSPTTTRLFSASSSTT